MLHALSPVDGRYRRHTEPLAKWLSEQGLIQHRVEVEIEYFLQLVAMPLPQLADFPVEKKKATDESAKLTGDHATNCRGIVARLNFLAQDRSQIQYAIKELSQEMASPTEDDWGRMKKVV